MTSRTNTDADTKLVKNLQGLNLLIAVTLYTVSGYFSIHAIEYVYGHISWIEILSNFVLVHLTG